MTDLTPLPHHDEEVLEALKDYILSHKEDKELVHKMNEDHESYDEMYLTKMCQGVSEMAMLIASAAFMDDESFTKVNKKILFESRNDSLEVKELREYYMSNSEELDMEKMAAIMDSVFDKEKFTKRIENFKGSYHLMHK